MFVGDDANKLKEFFDRKKDYNFTSDTSDSPVRNYGYFYLIQLVPETIPNRVKIGYTDNLEQRLNEHRTADPTLKLIGKWKCKRSWDRAAMDSITKENCELVLSEVYEGDIGSFIKRGNSFFAIMPKK